MKIIKPADWVRLLLGFGLVFALFHATATLLGSDRGQWGILIGALVIVGTAAAEWFLLADRQGAIAALRKAVAWPHARGIVAATCASVLLLAAGFAYAWLTGMTATLYQGWIWLLPGLFAQAGIAEELLFRGFLFSHLRTGRTFWRAATVSMLPFVAVHLILFISVPWPVALASVLLAVVMSFPLAHLFELGGNTIWAPALLHFVVQGTVKVVVFAEGAESFALAWIAGSAVIPLTVFTLRTHDR